MKIKKILKSLVILSFFFSSLVFAIDLDDAKDKGLVGEKDNGYLGLVVEQNDAQNLIDDINNKRKVVYLRLAEKNGITLQQVEKLAAQKAYEKTNPGHYIWVNGSWTKK